jgi:chromate transporter
VGLGAALQPRLRASIVNISTAVVFVVAPAALFYFKSKFAIPLVVAGAALAGYALSLVSS